MRPSRAIPATLAILAIAAPAAAARPTVRVETVSKELIGPTTSGSVRSYVDTAGAAHVLPAEHRARPDRRGRCAARPPGRRPVLRQFSSGLLTRFGSAKPPASGGWQFTVDGVPPQVGADATVVPKHAEVVWWLIDDFAHAGRPAAARPRPRRPLAARHAASSASRGSTPKAARCTAAKGAQLRIAGRSLTVPASGLVTVHLRRGTRVQRPGDRGRTRSARSRSAARRSVRRGRRSAWLLLGLLVAACGEHRVQPPVTTPAAPAAQLVISEDFGAHVLRTARVAPGQSVMAALQGAAKVSTTLRRPVRAVDRRHVRLARRRARTGSTS